MTTDNEPTVESSQPSAANPEPASAADPPAATPAADPPAAPEPPKVDPVVAERDHLKEQLLRTAADFDNFRKRARREIEEARLRGKDDAIKEVLPVLDNLERAVAAADSAQSVGSVVEGVKMVLKLFEDTSERIGLSRIKATGERFDPAVHEAIQQQETDAHPPGTILTEVVPGYMFGQRLLRAAMVVVARKPAPKPVEAPPAPPDEPASPEPAAPPAGGDHSQDGGASA